MKSFFSRIISIPKALFNRFKALSFKKKLLIIIVFVIAIFIVLQAIGNGSKEPGYTTAKVTKADITEVVSESGSIVTAGRTDIYSPTNGIVEEVYVKNGDVVEEGQQLFKVESSATEQEVHQARANYLAAVASLNSAKSTADTLRAGMYDKWKRYTDMATNSTYENDNNTPNEEQRKAAEFQIVQDTWKAAEAQYKDQQTAIAQAQSAVASTSLTYQATQNAVVKAANSGQVANLSVRKGNSVNAHTPTSVNPPVLTIANFASTEVSLYIGETDIAKVKDGQKATVDVNAVRDKKYDGVVSRVDSVGTLVQGVMRYGVYVEVAAPDNALRPGMSTDVDITTEELNGILTVPNSAVKPYQGGRAVRVFDEKTKEIKYIPVKVGIRGDSKTQILDGVTEGQEVIVSLSNESIKRPGLF